MAFRLYQVPSYTKYFEGDIESPPAKNLQTPLIPAGGCTVIELSLPVPGTYTIVDHSIWRIEKGGFICVEGKSNPELYWGSGPPEPCPDCQHHP